MVIRETDRGGGGGQRRKYDGLFGKKMIGNILMLFSFLMCFLCASAQVDHDTTQGNQLREYIKQ